MSKLNFLGLIGKVVLYLIIRLPTVQLISVDMFELVKVVFMHDASNEVAKPKHG